MEKVTFVETTDPMTNEVTEHAIIEHADGSFTSMFKSTYEAQQVEHLTEIPTPDEA
jgi:hypothetical protein